MTLRRRHLLLAASVLAAAVLASILAPQFRWGPGALVLTGLIGALVLWMGGHVLERRARASVIDLAGRVRDISEGAFARRPSWSQYPPEVEQLAAALHDMAEQLGERFKELESQRNQMQAVIESIAEGVIALTEDARVLRMNSAAADLLDITQSTPFAPIGTLVRHPKLRDHLEESVVAALPAKEIRLGHRYLIISSHVMESGGSVVTLLDVTEVRQMEQVRKDFVANASHEMKTPLTSIRGFAETLLDGDPPERLRREFLNSIRSNAIRLQNLVDDLLDLSRLESGRWSPIEEEVRLAECARQVWHELGADQGPGRVEFGVRGDAIVLADSQALHQIFRNLYDNALRYTPEGGEISVRIDPHGRHAQVAVADSGTGIPSSALPRIFERFYRADPGRDRTEGGTGLGLAIVRHLVQSMGGEVAADSELGYGTTIRFSMPRVEDTETVEEARHSR